MIKPYYIVTPPPRRTWPAWLHGLWKGAIERAPISERCGPGTLVYRRSARDYAPLEAGTMPCGIVLHMEGPKHAQIVVRNAFVLGLLLPGGIGAAERDALNAVGLKVLVR